MLEGLEVKQPDGPRDASVVGPHLRTEDPEDRWGHKGLWEHRCFSLSKISMKKHTQIKGVLLTMTEGLNIPGAVWN